MLRSAALTRVTAWASLRTTICAAELSSVDWEWRVLRTSLSTTTSLQALASFLKVVGRSFLRETSSDLNRSGGLGRLIGIEGIPEIDSAERSINLAQSWNPESIYKPMGVT